MAVLKGTLKMVRELGKEILYPLTFLSWQWSTRLCYLKLLQARSLKSKVSWEQVCTPKKDGGLGLKRINELNKAACNHETFLGSFHLGWLIVGGKGSWNSIEGQVHLDYENSRD